MRKITTKNSNKTIGDQTKGIFCDLYFGFFCLRYSTNSVFPLSLLQLKQHTIKFIFELFPPSDIGMI